MTALFNLENAGASCTVSVNGVERQCCPETGTCTEASCVAFALQDGVPVDLTKAKCDWKVPDCPSKAANGQTCYGRVVCTDGTNNCPGRNQLCMHTEGNNAKTCTASDRQCQRVTCLNSSAKPVSQDGAVFDCPEGLMVEPCSAEPGCAGVKCPPGRSCISGGKCVCPEGFMGDGCKYKYEAQTSRRSGRYIAHHHYPLGKQACMKECSADKKCKAWSFNNLCFLSPVVSVGNPDGGYNSGKKGQSGIEADMQYTGRDTTRNFDVDQKGCQEACEKDANCKVWSHLRSCYLENVVNPPISDPSSVSGLIN